MQVEIRNEPGFRLAAIRHIGPYDGIGEAFDRLFAVDLDGKPGDELLASDDGRRGLVAFAVAPGGRGLRQLAAWPVYENRAYPYGGGDEKNPREAEPRAIAAGDFDGDGARDLALVIHDRLLFYLGRAPMRSTP